MNILEANQEWPTHRVIENGAPKTVPYPSEHVVADGVGEWQRNTIIKPTHLIVPLRLKNDFLANIGIEAGFRSMQLGVTPVKDDEFLGLQVLYSRGDTMQLLTANTDYP